jgi:phosphoribosyl-ATP pyrophosphohydrolase
MSQSAVLARLTEVIRDRKARRPPGSYTTQLLDGGVGRIGAKVLEEAAEVVEAAGNSAEDGGRAVVNEAADLTYHLLVLLAACGRGFEEVEDALARRFGVSGLEEKAGRERPRPPEHGSADG